MVKLKKTKKTTKTIRKPRPIRRTGQVLAIRRLAKEEGEGYHVTVFTGRGSFTNILSTEKLRRMIPPKARPGWLSGRTCLYEFHEGRSRQIVGLAGGKKTR